MIKGSSTCTAILVLTLFASSVTIIILLSKSQDHTSEYGRYFSDIRTNHQKTGYDDLKVQKIPCSQDYESIINYKIPSIKNHCKKPLSDYKEGNCKFNDFIAQEYKQMDQISIENIRGLFFCGRRSKVDFFDTKSYSDDGHCPQDFKLCGKDSLKRLCFSKSFECPINDIKIFEQKQDHLVQQGYKEQKIFDIRNESLFVYTSTQQINNQIPVNFNFGYQQICVDPHQEQAPLEQFKFFDRDYQLQCKSNLGQYSIDDRYTQIMTTNKLQLYKDNKIIEDIDNYYDSFDPSSLNYDFELFYRPNIHQDEKCRKFLNNEQNQNFDRTSLEKIAYYKSFLIFCYIVFSISILVSLIVLFLNFGEPKNQIFYFLLITFIQILFVIAFILILMFLTRLKNRSNIIIELAQMNCGDKIFNSLLKDLAKKSQDLNSKILFCTILIGLCLLFYLTYLCLLFCCKKRKKTKNYNHLYYNLDESRTSSNSNESFRNPRFKNTSKFSNEMKKTHYTDHSTNKNFEKQNNQKFNTNKIIIKQLGNN